MKNPMSVGIASCIFLLMASVGPIQAKEKLILSPLAAYETGIFNKSAAEIVVYNKRNNLFYVVNGAAPAIDVFRLNGQKTVSQTPLKLASDEAPTSVATYGNIIVVTVHDSSQDHRPGKIVLFNLAHHRIAEFPAGSLPDMVSFSPKGDYILVANEGEPGKTRDPDGSLTLITVNHQSPALSKIKQITFSPFDTEEMKKIGVRIAPDKSFAQDAEAEYIAFAPNGQKAWASLQENNALAEIDLKKSKVTKIIPLGVKDHNILGQGIDPNDKDGINIITVPVKGMYMPDAIATLEYKGINYILTANEGDARDEDVKAKKANFDEKALTKKQKKSLGSLRLSSTDGDTDNDGDIDVPHSYGARSFSIFAENGSLVFDSGDDFEQITARIVGEFFNSDNDEANKADKRSDNKGPEPEGITTGTIKNRTFAFITLERVGGIMVYDVTNPTKPAFQSYYVSRTFSTDFDFTNEDDRKKAGFLGPEGIYFISAKDSPTKKPLLLVANEVSGNVEILAINDL